jgi:choline monooxygenase
VYFPWSFAAPMSSELDRFDAARPIDVAETPPASWYTSPEFLELERRTVFRRSWQPVARGDQLAHPGDFVAGDVAGEPFVVLRDDTGTLRAFFNVCRHHASCVAQGEGNAERLICPYHGWTYDLDGRLHSAPRMAGVKGFDREQLGLQPMAVAERAPCVLVRLDQAGPPVERVWGPLNGRLDTAGLRFVKRVSYEIECNWKVFVDNYLDGGYHVAHLHGGLASRLDLESYTTEVLGDVSLQTCRAGGDSSPPAADFAERIGEGAVYAYVYPNFMLNRYGPILDTNWALPLGAERTLTVFDYYFDARTVDRDPVFVERSLEASDRVQQEDIAICESVQRGLRSSAYDTGRYAPRLEQAAHRFHVRLSEDLRSD